MTAQERAEQVEHLSRTFHSIYQDEARRQERRGEDHIRHPDDYDALLEHTKEYDRVLARAVLKMLDEAVAAERARCADLAEEHQHSVNAQGVACETAHTCQCRITAAIERHPT